MYYAGASERASQHSSRAGAPIPDCERSADGSPLAEVYLDAVDFVSISVALYGLIVFYALVKERLAGRKPLAKFLCVRRCLQLPDARGLTLTSRACRSIKIVVMLLFYQ